jgi:hypothetical protein
LIAQYGLGTFRLREIKLGYLATAVIVVVAVMIGIAVVYVRHESRPDPAVLRRAALRQRRFHAGDLCVCGGTVERAGRTSPKFGELLSCPGCARTWTMDGRRVVRRIIRRPTRRPAAGSSD